MTYLIDTNIVIFALKDPERDVARRLASVRFNELAISSIVEAELYHGAEKYGRPEKRKALLREFLEPFQRIPFDSRCVPHYASIRHHLEERGQMIGANDLMIAATAMAHDLTVVTNNSDEFARVNGLKWDDWV